MNAIIRLNSGKLVDICHPKVADVTLADVSHHLSNLCRFTGGPEHFLSVAEHAVNLSRIVPPHLAMAALHHDDHEFVLGDISTPWKALLNAASNGLIDRITYEWDQAVAAAFGLADLSPADVELLHHYDVELRKAEAVLLMKGSTEAPETPIPLSLPLLSPKAAKWAYRHRHVELGGAQ